MSDLLTRHSLEPRMTEEQSTASDKPPARPPRATYKTLDVPTQNDNAKSVRKRSVLPPGLDIESIRTRRSDRSLRRMRTPEKAVIDLEIRSKARRRKGQPWIAPLTYPAGGKRPEVVTWDDLANLEDDTMLNETPILLFIRYLQENIDPELRRKIHFFNTYFYSTLTKPVEGNRSKSRTCNFKAVEKWTKHNNIFQQDFVIVPVHEAGHFYVMLICNLPALRREEEEEQGQEIDLDAKQPEADDIVLISTPPQPDAEVTNSVVPSEEGAVTLLSRTKKKKRGTSLRRYEVDKPIIIAMDSLGIGRSGTAATLKEYVVAEGAARTTWDISADQLPAMSAKGLPSQPNYVDCGLYICLYLERFMQDPYKFVKSILQRETAGLDWPEAIDSAELRQNLYDFLQELYTAQTTGCKPRIRPIGNILLPERPPLTVMTPDQIVNGARAYQKHSEQRPERLSNSTARADPKQDLNTDIEPVEGNERPVTERFTIEAKEEGPLQAHTSKYFPSELNNAMNKPEARFARTTVLPLNTRGDNLQAAVPTLQIATSASSSIINSTEHSPQQSRDPSTPVAMSTVRSHITDTPADHRTALVSMPFAPVHMLSREDGREIAETPPPVGEDAIHSLCDPMDIDESYGFGHDDDQDMLMP